MNQKKLQSDFVDRLRDLTEGDKPQPWAARFGWDRTLTSRIFTGKQLPNAEYLASMGKIDRVNIGWLLTGVGAPYEVLPPPHWDTLALGREVNYYLFATDGGL